MQKDFRDLWGGGGGAVLNLYIMYHIVMKLHCTPFGLLSVINKNGIQKMATKSKKKNVKQFYTILSYLYN